MSLELIINDLSLQERLNDLEHSCTVMNSFIETLSKCKKIYSSCHLRSTKGLLEYELHSGYFISNWCVEKKVDDVHRKYIKNVATKYPLLIELPEKLEVDIKESDASYNGLPSESLLIAHLTNKPIISFNSDKQWQIPQVQIKIGNLEVDKETSFENISYLDTTVTNLCIPQNVEDNESELKKIQFSSFENIDSFWQSKEQILPKLSFCKDIIKNLKKEKIDKVRLAQIVKKLSELNDYCKTWIDGASNIHKNMPLVSRESDSTMKMFGELRYFSDDNNNQHNCEMHCRLTPGAWRIHFFPKDDTRSIFIGYIGLKLKTRTDKT